MILFAAAGTAIVLSGLVDSAVLDKPGPGDNPERVLELERRRNGAFALVSLGGGMMVLSGGGMLYFQAKIWGTQTPESFLATDQGFMKPAPPSTLLGIHLEVAALRF